MTGRQGRRRRAPGELEVQVMAALHASPRPVSAAWVREILGGGFACTTVVTALTRLHGKGVVSRERGGRAFLWAASVDGSALAALRMRKVLDGQADRQAVLVCFLAALSVDDELLLRSLLGPGG